MPLTKPFTPEQMAIVDRQINGAVRTYRNKAIVGFLVLLLGIGWVNHSDRDNRVEAAKATTASRVEGVKAACAADLAAYNAQVKALNKNITFIQQSDEKPPPTIEERVAAVKDVKSTLLKPDCDARVQIALKGGKKAVEALNGN